MPYTLLTKLSFIIKRFHWYLNVFYCLVKKTGLFKCSQFPLIQFLFHIYLSIRPMNWEVLRQTELNFTYKVPFTNTPVTKFGQDK